VCEGYWVAVRLDLFFYIISS